MKKAKRTALVADLLFVAGLAAIVAGIALAGLGALAVGVAGGELAVCGVLLADRASDADGGDGG